MENRIKYTQLSKMFFCKGYKAQPQVIRSWLDEQSHIVGPNQEETFKYIQDVFGKDCLPGITYRVCIGNKANTALQE